VVKSTLLLGFALLVPLGGCGEPPLKGPDEAAPNFLSGIDNNEPIPGRPGFMRKEILTRGYALEPGRVNVHTEPFRVSPFSSDEDVWITNWESNTENEAGVREPDDIHCHATLSASPILADDVEAFRGLFTDGFTPVFGLPEGYALRVRKGERMLFQPMFNNRRPDARTARMRLKIDYVPHSKRPRDYTELRGTVMRVSLGDLYWVAPGEIDRRTRVIEAAFRGRIYAIGAHLHPYGDFVELERESTGAVIALCKLRPADDLADVRLDIVHLPQGVFVRRGERLRVTAVYNNTSDEKVDAMGGLFVLYDPKGEPDA
jgi:hypothetical protein